MEYDFFNRQINTIKKLGGEKIEDIEIAAKINSVLFDLNVDIFDLKNRKKNKKVLSVEVGRGHDIIRPSIWKYFVELGYEVDFLLYGNRPEDRWNFFQKIKNPQYREIVGDETFILSVLSLPVMSEYDYIIFNSNLVYNTDRIDSGWDYKTFLNELKVPKRCKYGYLTIPPHPVYYSNNKKDGEIRHFTSLSLKNTPMLSILYFGEIDMSEKSDKTIFLLSGNINDRQKNHALVIEAARKIYNEGVQNFELWINGSSEGEFLVSKEDENYIKYLGDNKPETLFPILEKTDFIISGMDSDHEWQKLVYSGGTCSSGFMYALGFGKIYILEDIFADTYGLNSDNSIIYKRNDLASALKYAVKMPKEEYKTLKLNFIKEREKRYKRSLHDISVVLKQLKISSKVRLFKPNKLIKFIKYMQYKICYCIFPKKREHYLKKIKKIF